MDILRPGDAMSIRHYSGVSPFKSIVLEVTGEMLTAKLLKDFAVMNFLEGDPVVFGYEYNDQVYIIGSNIISINAKADTVVLKIDKTEEGAEKRLYERVPVSLYCDIRTRDSKKKHLATVKDISYYGMLMYSKADFTANQQVEIDIYMEKTMVFLKANIVRKMQTQHCFEYGLGIVYEDANSLNFMKEYLKRLVQDQQEYIRKLKNKQ